jgi:uncharacterized protein (DUF433 family)
MSIEGLEDYSKDQLIEELINRQTFVGIVIFHREDAKDGRLDRGEIVMTKSPPLSRAGVEELLRLGQSLVPGMFVEQTPSADASGSLALLQAQPLPLRVDEAGAVRVGKTRITLDLLVEQFENGMTPEDLVRSYDTLELADVYAAIAFYLRRPKEVRAYLTRRNAEGAALRAQIESEYPRASREELLARRSAREIDGAPTGH